MNLDVVVQKWFRRLNELLRLVVFCRDQVRPLLFLIQKTVEQTGMAVISLQSIITPGSINLSLHRHIEHANFIKPRINIPRGDSS